MDKIRLLPLERPSRLIALSLLAAAPFAFGALALALGQDANWDLRNYHWYNAYAFVNGRHGIDLLPSQTPYFYNPLLDVPFYLLATHVPAKAAGFVLGFVQGFNFTLLFLLAHAGLVLKNPRQKVGVCAALAALGMLGGGGIALLGTTFYDNVTSLGLFVSALLVIRYHDRLIALPWRRACPMIFLFGLPAGLMMGLKLPCVIFAVGLCFGILFMGGPFRRLFVLSFVFGLSVLIGVAISLGPWAWFLQVNFGNPLFPYFNDLFKSPLAPSVSARDIKFLPHNFADYLFFPFHFASNPYHVGEIAWRDWRIPILYGLLPLAAALLVVVGRRGTKTMTVAYARRYLLAVGVISYLVWLGMFSIYRYAIPLEMLAPLLILMAVDLLPLKLTWRAVLTACLLVVVAASVQPGNWTRRSAWLDRFVEARVPPLPDAADLMILMAGFEPYSHVISEFPPVIPFVRIQSNFSEPTDGKGMNTLIHARIEAHKGRFMLLIPPWQLSVGAEALRSFHLALADEPCQTVIDRLYDDKPLSLCELVHSD